MANTPPTGSMDAAAAPDFGGASGGAIPAGPEPAPGPGGAGGAHPGVRVALNPAHVRAEPGATPAEATVTLQNMGSIVEEYSVEVLGLDERWFTLSDGGGIGLFPEDSGQVRLTFHPPVGPGLRAGTYPFEIRVRSQDGAHEDSVQGILELRGQAALRLDLVPLHRTARRRGRFTVRVSNSGTADARLTLEARDAEDACRIAFPKGDGIAVPAKGKVDLPLVVVPKRRGWTGQPRTYDFTVVGRSPAARRVVQPFPGQYTYRPYLMSIGIVFKLLLFAALAGVLLVGVPILWSASRPLRDELGRRYCTLTAGIPYAQDHWPCGVPETCSFQFYFREFSEQDRELAGRCTSTAMPDAHGNTMQYTTNGVFFWLKRSQTVYFLTHGKLYAFDDGQIRLVHDPGQ
jgi:hypothetical protein